MSMNDHQNKCPFCEPDPARVVARRSLAYVLRDGFPVSPGHMLVIPNRHVGSWFDATDEERSAILKLLNQVKTMMDDQEHPDGYNIGINVGETAGQTVMHLHVHLIPRYEGDVSDPTGGVRFVIPSKGNYRRPGFVPEWNALAIVKER